MKIYVGWAKEKKVTSPAPATTLNHGFLSQRRHLLTFFKEQINENSSTSVLPDAKDEMHDKIKK